MSRDPILISLFNHKGGVSKTTTTFNLGWTFAKKGLKTLIVDADPQCNLTSYVLGLQQKEEMDSFYKNVENDNIHSKLSDIIEGKNVVPQPVKPCKTLNDNLFLIAGNLLMSDLDINLTTGLTSGRFLPFAKQFIGAFHKIVRSTAINHQCEIILVDMSPNAGAMNRCVLMSSDYFLIPTSPDFFSYQAIQSLGDMLPKWDEDFKEFRTQSTTNALPENPPRMLGIISQKYRPYTKRIPTEGLIEKINIFKRNETEEKKKQGIAKSFKDWIDKIQEASKNILAEELKNKKMVIEEDLFKKYVQDESPYNLISIGDFNSLIALSQKFSKPIFELTDSELDFKGNVLQQMKENQEQFENAFEYLATRICNIIIEDSSINKLFKNFKSHTPES